MVGKSESFAISGLRCLPVATIVIYHILAYYNNFGVQIFNIGVLENVKMYYGKVN